MEKNISVLMSVYKNDKPEQIAEAVESVANQTLKAKQIVIVIDGPVSEEISKILKDLSAKYSEIEIYPLEQNVGLGKAMNYGFDKCRYEFIARMDSDDISVPERFEKQMKCFENDADLDIVGANCQEFFETLDNLASIKVVPEHHEQIVEFMKGRSPMVHPSVMAKKEMFVKAGGYQDWYYAEDWYLWIRMYLAGAKFYNIQECLLMFRVSYDTYERRGGLKMYKSIRNLLKFMKQKKMIGTMKYMKENVRRFVGHVLVPKKLKKKLYMRFMRSEK